jgi:pyridoxamine 5'-phosphate oxidase
MDKEKLASLRRDYSSRQLSRDSVAKDPFTQFGNWMAEALNSQIIDATAMLLATADAKCRPSARVVLLKAFDENGFVFYTNYESKKSRDIAGNPQVSLHFFWPDLERQLIITGTAEKISRVESEVYFNSRPEDSKLGAWASKQSSVLANRRQLQKQFAEAGERFQGQNIPCPPFWGGYRVTPITFEFWQGRASRLHDRIRYELAGDEWNIVRLSP